MPEDPSWHQTAYFAMKLRKLVIKRGTGRRGCSEDEKFGFLSLTKKHNVKTGNFSN